MTRISTEPNTLPADCLTRDQVIWLPVHLIKARRPRTSRVLGGGRYTPNATRLCNSPFKGRPCPARPNDFDPKADAVKPKYGNYHLSSRPGINSGKQERYINHHLCQYSIYFTCSGLNTSSYLSTYPPAVLSSTWLSVPGTAAAAV